LILTDDWYNGLGFAGDLGSGFAAAQRLYDLVLLALLLAGAPAVSATGRTRRSHPG
jgi:hypothetical protein